MVLLCFPFRNPLGTITFFLRAAVGNKDFEADPKAEGSSLERVSQHGGSGSDWERQSCDSGGWISHLYVLELTPPEAFFRANTTYEPSASGLYTKWLLLKAS